MVRSGESVPPRDAKRRRGDWVMPIVEQVYRILYEDMEPKEAMITLMSRDLGYEHDKEEDQA